MCSIFISILLFNIIVAFGQDNSPPCESQIYCYGDMLKTVQTARLYNDSKTFVDLRMKFDEEKIMKSFEKLRNASETPSEAELRNFVNENFEDIDELETWSPTDWTENPAILNRVKDPQYKTMLSDLVVKWKDLARKTKNNAGHSKKTSLIHVSHGFIVPGGRFKEMYYWDTYWIVQGLLLSDMHETARGVIENLLDLVEKYGLVPNGNRIYYLKRSQPPLLAAMVWNYVQRTGDIAFVNKYIATLEKEVRFWFKNRLVRDFKQETLVKYDAKSCWPRPEAFVQDFNSSFEDNCPQVYVDIKSAAESGWDFSSRWTNDDNEIFTTNIVPVDLNAILCGACRHLKNLYKKINATEKIVQWHKNYKLIRESIERVLWNKNDGIWYDYDLRSKKHRKQFFASNIAPLWTECVNPSESELKTNRAYEYFEKIGALNFPGGVPVSLKETGQQWDLPNAWPQLQGIIVQSLAKSSNETIRRAAFDLADRWVWSNYLGWKNNGGVMYEKYDASHPGRAGSGGEYPVQSGFGWTNGVVFELMNAYADKLSPGSRQVDIERNSEASGWPGHNSIYQYYHLIMKYLP